MTCCRRSSPRWTSTWPSRSSRRWPPRWPSATAATRDKGELGDAFAAFAAQRLGWTLDPARVFAIPDVMTGLAEVVQAVTPPGSGIVVNPPVYPPFRFRFGFYGRRIIDAPLASGPRRAATTWTPTAIEAGAEPAGRGRLPAVQPAQPDRQRMVAAEQLAMVADLCQRHGAVAAGGRDPRPAGAAGRALRAVPAR